MPKKYGFKEKDQVVAHIVTLVLTGKLRSGDRLDRNEIAEQLGLSRAPVQEAVVQLEHDGVLSTKYHRGAYVERFDEGVVQEHHEIYGALNGIPSARAAVAQLPKTLEQLRTALDALHATKDTWAFADHTWRYRKVINDRYAGPRLQAAIRASQIFMPRSFWVAYQGWHDQLLTFYDVETAAIVGGDADAARAACAERAAVMGRIMLAELIRRRVVTPTEEPVAF